MSHVRAITTDPTLDSCWSTVPERLLLICVGVATVGTIAAASVLLFVVGLITTAGEVTGFSDPGSRFPHLRRFFGRFE